MRHADRPSPADRQRREVVSVLGRTTLAVAAAALAVVTISQATAAPAPAANPVPVELGTAAR
jgi:hypothetical protein